MKTDTLADRIKAAMKEKNDMTQAQLAEASGLAQPTIWRLVNGKASGSTKLVDIAKALGVDINWLSNGIGEMYADGKNGFTENTLTYTKVLSVNVYDGETMLNESILAPSSVITNSTRAYKINKNTGVIEAPKGTLIVIDTEEEPGDKDLVYAVVNNNYSVYRYVEGGSGYLSVDDSRVPLLPITDSTKIIGVVVYLSREIKRRK